jgi:alanine racemase
VSGLLSAEVTIDLDAIQHNVRRLREVAGHAEVCAVVKADAYGHGLLPCARAAVAGGATWLATAALSEAVALRSAGIADRVLAWLGTPGDQWAAAVEAGVDVTASAPWAVAEIAAAAVTEPARVHLKLDTGLGRNGATPDDWPDLIAAARAAEIDGTIQVVGVWSHLAYADSPMHPTVGQQVSVFARGWELALRAGLRPQLRHLANSAATLRLPETHFDMVRPGIAVYGLSPGPEVGSVNELELRPAMTVSARLALTKRVPVGTGVSYAHTYHTADETCLGLVPMGYADGVPRNASSVGPLWIAGRRYRIAGRVCMDQFVVDMGDDVVAAGEEVVLFGSGSRGEPTAEDWATATGTIAYEIVTRMGARVPRRYLGGPDEPPG